MQLHLVGVHRVQLRIEVVLRMVQPLDPMGQGADLLLAVQELTVQVPDCYRDVREVTAREPPVG